MNKKDFQALINTQFEQIISLTATKGEEYSQSIDQLANFKRQAAELSLSPEKVLMVYLNKHLDSIRGYVHSVNYGNPANLSEPISGRIDDAILYLLLLQAMVVERRDGTSEIVEEEPSINAPVPPSNGFPVHTWRVLEEGDGMPVVLRAAQQHFDMGFVTGTEHGEWCSQQLRNAMERLTNRPESSS